MCDQGALKGPFSAAGLRALRPENSIARVCAPWLVSCRMRTSLRRDLTAALKARDRVSVAALRSALAAIENAEALPADQLPASAANEPWSANGVGAAEAQPRHLTEADLREIVEREVRERSVAADEYEQIGRHDRAESLRSEAAVLSRYLPPAG